MFARDFREETSDAQNLALSSSGQSAQKQSQPRFRDRDQALAWAFIEPTANESINHKARFGKAQNWCGPSIERAIAPESGKHLPQLRAVTCSPFWEV
jgi:hypothetical protein